MEEKKVIRKQIFAAEDDTATETTDEEAAE